MNKKRILATGGAVALVGVMLAAGATWRLKQQQAEDLAVLTRETHESAQAARDLLEQGAYDFKLRLGRPFLQTVLAQLEGFEHVSGRHSLHLERVEASFQDGFIQLDATAKLRVPLYRGKARVRWYTFTRVLEDGRCHLVFRVAQALPDKVLFLKGSWLEPWIMKTVHSNLKLPELTLPLGVEREVTLPEVDRKIKSKDITITIPTRQVVVKASHPQVIVTPDALIAVASRPDRVATEEAPPQEMYPDGLSLMFRFSLLGATLDELITPPRDALVHAERVPDVWRERKKMLGIKVNNHADLVDVDGYLDIQRSDLVLQDGQLMMDLAVSGSVSGRVEGKAYGISLDTPFTVEPHLDERIPIDLTNGEDALMLSFPPYELTLDLALEVEIAGRNVKLHHDLKLDSEEILRPIAIPHFFERDIEIPRKMRKKEVIEKVKVPIKIDWHMDLPSVSEGFLSFSGELSTLEP